MNLFGSHIIYGYCFGRIPPTSCVISFCIVYVDFHILSARVTIFKDGIFIHLLTILSIIYRYVRAHTMFVMEYIYLINILNYFIIYTPLLAKYISMTTQTRAHTPAQAHAQAHARATIKEIEELRAIMYEHISDICNEEETINSDHDENEKKQVTNTRTPQRTQVPKIGFLRDYM